MRVLVVRYLLVLGCVVSLLGAAVASACSLQSTGEDATGYTVVVSGVGTLRVEYADLVDGSAARRADDLRSRLQAAFDVRTPLLEVPIDDADKLTNPDRASLFYGDINGDKDDGTLAVATRYLVGRSCIVSVTPITRSSFDVTFTRAP